MEKTGRDKRYCVAYWCLNSDKKNPDLSFFSLPVDPKRRQQWLKLIGRDDLSRKANLKCKSYVVCSAHFEPSEFRVVRHLKNDALPNPVSVKKPSLQETPEISGDKNHQPPLQSSEKATTSVNFNQTMRVKQAIPIPVTKDPIYIYAQNDDDDVVNRFHKLIELKNKWAKKDGHAAEFKRFALNLHIYSSHAYQCLKTVLQLPSKKSLLSYKLNIPPSLDDKVLYRLEMKLKSLPDEANYCVVCVDKIPLQSKIYYDTKADEITGFHSINERKKTEIAKNAFAITIQGIYFKWQQPVAYALLGDGDYYNELDSWICNVISKLSGIGFLIKAIISDDSSYFTKFAKDVKNVTEVEPYISFNNTQTFYIFDVSHLMISIRNHLLTSDLYYGNKHISWKYIKTLYNHEALKENKRRLIPKFTSSHINPNETEKYNTQFAVESLSRTVSAALHTYIDLGHISEEARPTAHFIEILNNLFELFNSSNLKCKNEIQSALVMSEVQKKVLKEAEQIFTAIESSIMTTNRETIKNFQISIKAIQMLYENLKTLDGYAYLPTRRLNKDCLKLFYESRVPRQSICNNTPIQFRRKFSGLVLRYLMKTYSPNTSHGLDLCDVLSKVNEVNKFASVPEPSPISAVALGLETDYQMDLPENDTLVYVSSYLFFKCTRKHKCISIGRFWDSCRSLRDSNLFDNDLNEKLGFYGSLKIPPIEFIQYIREMESIITQNLFRIIKKSPGSQLLKLLKTVPAKVPCACFPLIYLLKLFVRLRIYQTLKFNNSGNSSEKKFLRIKHL